MKILIAEPDEILGDLMKCMIESRFGIETIRTRTSLDALDAIDAHSGLLCVISEHTLSDGQSNTICQRLGAKKPKIPFVLCSTPLAYGELSIFDKSALAGVIEKPSIIEPLKAIVGDLIAKAQAPSPPPVQKYVPIGTSALLKFGTLDFELFLKLSESKYVKIFQPGNVFETSDFDRLQSKNVSHLYVESHKAVFFIERMVMNLGELSRLENMAPARELPMTTSAVETIASFSQALGFTNEVQELTKKTVEIVIRSIASHPQLNELFKIFEDSPGAYISSHSTALAYLASGMTSKLGWISELTVYKLTMAAFLHDLALSDDKLARVNTITEMDSLRAIYPEGKILAALNHPSQGANMVRQLKDLPPDIDVIIAQHHELPDGMGFPAGLTHLNIAPLAAVFIVAHDLIDRIWGRKSSSAMGRVLESMRENYSQGHFRKIFKALEDSLHNQAAI